MRLYALPAVAAILALASCGSEPETTAQRAPDSAPMASPAPANHSDADGQRTQRNDAKTTATGTGTVATTAGVPANQTQRTGGDRDKLAATGAPDAVPTNGTAPVVDTATRGAHQAVDTVADAAVPVAKAPMAHDANDAAAPGAPTAEAKALPPRTAADHADAAAHAADDTGRNLREDGSKPTPLDQGNNDRDIGITSAIRTTVVDREDLSVNAKNVKIITREGVVTLRGPVADARERDIVVAAATSQKGVVRVDNQLDLVQP